MSPEDRPTRVGIGLIGRSGRYLIRQRLEGQTMAGYWEFPGGKCEPRESPEAATARECLEEVGVAVVVQGLVRRFAHRYPHAFVELSYYDCELDPFDAEPSPDSGFTWVSAEQLPTLRFPGANDPIIEELVARSGR